MHDDGSAFIGLDKKFSMKNILCTKDVSNNADKVSGGLGLLHNKFRQAVMTVLYNQHFETDRELVDFIENIYNECKSVNHERSCTFLSNLKRNRANVAAFHTQQYFTAQQRATTRGEGSNSRLKGKGELKEELLHSDLVRSIN